MVLESPWGPDFCQTGVNCTFKITALFGETPLNYTVYTKDAVYKKINRKNHTDFEVAIVFASPGEFTSIFLLNCVFFFVNVLTFIY